MILLDERKSAINVKRSPHDFWLHPRLRKLQLQHDSSAILDILIGTRLIGLNLYGQLAQFIRFAYVDETKIRYNVRPKVDFSSLFARAEGLDVKSLNHVNIAPKSSLFD